MPLIRQLLRALLALGAITWCGAAAAEELVIPGSGNPEHVLGALADAFNRQQPQHRVLVPPTSGTAGALRDVESGAASVGRVGRPLKADEKARGLVYVPFGRDPVAFVGGAGVGVKGLSAAQLVAAYSGASSNWSELGATPGPLRVVGRESTDASRQAINRSIRAFETIVFGESVKLVHLDPQMIELLDRFPGSLGFLNRSALQACKTRVVLLALDGVEPTAQNIEAGRYPLWLEFGLIHKPGGLGPAAKAFVEFIRSAAGVRILRELGVLPTAAAV
jgi:phosphate transport system substrate-binding protein